MKSYIVLSLLCCVFATPTILLPSRTLRTDADHRSCENKPFIFCNGDGNVAVCNGPAEQVIIKCESGSNCNALQPFMGCQRTATSPSSNNVGSCVNNKIINISLMDCASYGKCVNGVLKVLHCPKKTCFDVDRYACIPGKCEEGKCVEGSYNSK